MYLCKWSKNTFSFRRRKLPSGEPHEKIITFKKGDPTWTAELLFFKNLIKKKINTSINKDIIINK